MNRRLAAVSWLALAAWADAAWAQDVTLAGRMGERALLMIGGSSHVLAVGQSMQGVKLLRWEGDTAVVEQSGTQLRLHVGAAPARLGASIAGAHGREIVIPAGPGGHFLTAGSINGQAVNFMVDTGATLVSLSLEDARRLGLELRAASRVVTQTAAGAVPALRLTLQRLRVGDVEVYNVDALVSATPLPFVLLGNSFLQRFQMRRDNDVMRLELR